MNSMLTLRFFIFATTTLAPGLLFAQAPPDVVFPSPSTLNVASSQSTRQVPTHGLPRYKKIYPHFFAGASKHPLTPRDVAIREAVESLGVDHHRFVRCDLLDGTSVKGGILSIGQESFQLSHGILQGQRRILYSSLKTPPRPDAAPAEHLVNALQWTGYVATGIIAAPGLFIMGLSCNFSCS